VPVTLVRLELYDLASDELLGFADLRGGDFRQPDVYQEFPIDFWLSPTASGRVSVRLSATGEAEVAFDRLRVLRGPQPFETDIPCRLQHRAGPQTVVIKALDAAGNPAVELTGATQLVDTAPPGAWQLLAPTGWVTTTIRPTVRVYVADELTGIAPDSAAGRFTTDAGLSWSTWQPISATVKPDGSAELTWVWPGGEGAGAHRAQFRVADNAELTAVSPAWPVRVDMTLPTATLSAPRRAIAGAPFTVQWAGWDNIGVASFDVQRSIENDTWQDWLSGTTATQAGYLAPAPGPVRLRVRARDLAGNTGPWSAAQTVAVVGLRFLPFVANR
jgi:hypothetical protein